MSYSSHVSSTLPLPAFYHRRFDWLAANGEWRVPNDLHLHSATLLSDSATLSSVDNKLRNVFTNKEMEALSCLIRQQLLTIT